MKKTLLFFASLMSAFVFAEDTWTEECPKIELTEVFTLDNDATNTYKLEITIDNTSSDPFGGAVGFCYYATLLTTSNVVMTGANNECVNSIPSGENRVLTYYFEVSDDQMPSIAFQLKLKNPLADEEYCLSEYEFGINSSLSLEEADLTDVPFVETYFDLMGRKVDRMVNKGFYIVKRNYENGYESVEKVFNTVE